MDWSSLLDRGESVRWEGRPAPRCWTFRNWRHSIFGVVLLAVAGWWQFTGYSLVAEYGWWVACLPAPVVLVGLYLTFGHLLLARWQWASIYYAVTDRRIVVRGGKVMAVPLSALTWLRMEYHGTSLATILLATGDETPLLRLSCIEHPERLLPFLEEAIRVNTAFPRDTNQ